MGETPSAAEDVAGLEPGGRLGRYVLEGRLGSGGMGDVWKARDTSLNRIVAVKVLKSVGVDEVARFRREAHVAGRLAHPNIAAVYEVGEDRGRHFIAMQFVDGRTLRNPWRKDRRALVEAVRDAARALDFAHAGGVVHRDVKPENVMVAADGHVFVMDFGLARPRAGAGLTATGIVMGTPPYMAPEQARGDEVDLRTDVFALGATLYELLTGRKAFEGESDLETLRRVCEDEPRPPRSIDRTIDEDLQTVVLKCLEKEPRARYPRAGTLADDLDRWLAGEPIAARPLGAVERLARWMRRHRAWTAATAAVALVVVSASIALVMQQVRASRREAADRELAAAWSRIIESKRELRLTKTSPQNARDGLLAAVREVDAYVQARPDDPRGWYVRARGRLYLDDLAGAAADARQAIARDGSFRAAWTVLGMARVEEAHRYLRGQKDRPKAAAILRDAADAFARGGEGGGLPRTREDDVIERTARALRLWYGDDRKEDARAVLVEAVREYRAEEYAFWLGVWSEGEERERWWGLAVEWAPGHVDALWNLGVTSRDPKRGLELHDRALDLRPGFALAYLTRAVVKRKLRDAAGAVADATRAIELGLASAEAYATRGAARYDLRDAEGARADSDRALSLDSSHETALWTRMDLRFEARDWHGVVEIATELIKVGHIEADALSYRASALARLDRFEDALRDANRAIELRPSAAFPYQQRGTVRLALDDPAGAKADLDRALELKPDDPETLDLRGQARELLGDRRGAAADYEAALRHAPDGWALRAEVEKRLEAVRR